MPEPSGQGSRTVRLLRTTSDLEAFLPAWTALWQSDPNRTPFQHPTWLLPWWHQFGQPDLRAVVVSVAEQPVAFLPFYLYPEPDGGPRKLLLIGAGTSDYLDGLFASDCTVEDVMAGLQALLAEPGFDTLDAVQLRPESLLTRALQHLGAAESAAEPTSIMPALALADLPTKIRRNAMYYRNRAERDATLELTFATEADCLEHFEQLVRLHGARWQERGEPGVLDDLSVLAWHREALPHLAAAGLLRLATLTRNGDPLGLMYALADDPGKADANGQPNRTLYLYLPAFSLQHRDLRPGTVLLALLIDHAAREGFTTVDMLRGGESYKQLWHVAERPTVALTFRPERA
ncbi:GNAT family N-acetyltransferase [Terriglobus aquaticus]|uniref:GNAT family N-acetyltransferase n=1 Tax=Terriglobus aquaticus TaxID=940139 RepID=A0ABW9KQE5_9BACT|nr:GNAT family N-acetyltransferase [Terriglobus aquaticus]